MSYDPSLRDDCDHEWLTHRWDCCVLWECSRCSAMFSSAGHAMADRSHVLTEPEIAALREKYGEMIS